MLALTLASLRGLPELFAAQSQRRWQHAQFPGLAGRKVLLIGTGGVGRQIQKRLLAFEVDLIRIARNPRDDESGHIHDLESLSLLLPTAEVVVLAIPLTAETRGLVSPDFLARMKVGSLLVNVSRGSVIDTDALTEAVARGRVRAALDVTEPEPLPACHRLWTLPGVIITPHVGGHTGAMAGRIDRLINKQIRLAQAGLPPVNVVLST